jgi:hypothetical protein
MKLADRLAIAHALTPYITYWAQSHRPPVGGAGSALVLMRSRVLLSTNLNYTHSDRIQRRYKEIKSRRMTDRKSVGDRNSEAEREISGILF